VVVSAPRQSPRLCRDRAQRSAKEEPAAIVNAAYGPQVAEPETIGADPPLCTESVFHANALGFHMPHRPTRP
jgi:hypothetical protein